MPRASKQKAKGGVHTSPKNVSATVRSLQRSAKAHQAAVKQLLSKRRQKKNAEEARVQVAIATSKLEEEKLDAEAILRQAVRSGMKTSSLKEAIEFASEALSAVSDAPKQNNPPNPETRSTISEQPDLSTVVEGEEEEDTTELDPVSTPVPVTGEGRKNTRRASRAKETAKAVTNLRATRSNPNPLEEIREEEEEDSDLVTTLRSDPKSKSLRLNEVAESPPSQTEIFKGREAELEFLKEFRKRR